MYRDWLARSEEAHTRLNASLEDYFTGHQARCGGEQAGRGGIRGPGGREEGRGEGTPDLRGEADRKKHAEELAHTITFYKGSEEFVRDARAYAQEHIDDLVTAWLDTEAGQVKLTEDGLLMFRVGQYGMQRDIYAVLRQRDSAFNPDAWGLPAELEDPEAQGRSLPTPGGRGPDQHRLPQLGFLGARERRGSHTPKRKVR